MSDWAMNTFIEDGKAALKWFDVRFGSNNLIDFNTVNYTDNKYINKSNGGLGNPSATGGWWAYTDYIAVEPGAKYYFEQINASASLAGVAFYDANYTALSGAGYSTTELDKNGNVVVCPENAAYMRHSFRIDEGYNVDWRSTVRIYKVEE